VVGVALTVAESGTTASESTSAGAAAAAEKASGGKLAYRVFGSHERTWIVATNIDGTKVRQLVRPVHHDWSEYSWSPDGKKLAASLDEIVVARDGGPTRTVVPAAGGTGIDGVRWSPKKNSLAFIRKRTFTCAGAAVWIVDAAGRNRRRLTRPASSNSLLTTEDWSPDGKRLLYQATTYDDQCSDPLRSRLITVGRDGSSPRVVTNVIGGAWRAAWSPSGSRIAYLTCAFHGGWLPCEVWVVDVAGSNRHRVGGEVNMWGGPGLKWTRDGRELVIPYLCAPGDCVSSGDDCDAKTWSGGLRAIDVATGQTRALVNRPGCASPELRAISRSGSTVAFVWVALDETLLGRPMLVGLDGTGLRALPPPPKIAGSDVSPWPAFYLP
jgi:Tol biopolymer transport system component